MPTINMYQDGSGFYIRARPSDETGTITYKIHSFGNPVVREMDFKDGQEISWESIDALKSLGIVYTEGSGTVAPDDFDPNPDLLQKHSISEHKAQRMLTAVRKHLDVDSQQLYHAADALGISYNRDERENGRDSSADSQLSYTLVKPDFSYDKLKPGKKYVGKIDRVSNAGNGIIELDGGFINIGQTGSWNVGDEVGFVFSEGTFCEVVGAKKAHSSNRNNSGRRSTDDGHSSPDLGEYLTAKDRRLLDEL